VPPQERRPDRRPDQGRRPDRPGQDRRSAPDRRPTGDRGGPTAGRRDNPSARSQRPTRSDDEKRHPRLPEPELPADLPPAELDRDARHELRNLPESLAKRLTDHLVAAGLLIDDEPDRAHAHAWYARSLAPRLAIVREAAGLTAYRTGDYSAALAELRAVRRMTGDPSHLPVLADAERGLGRPERALALAKDPDVRRLGPAERVELAIVASGARRDLGQADAAVVGLQGAALDADRIEPWTARLWYAYAEALLAAGRRDEALRWFESAAAIDDDGETDADERVAALADGDVTTGSDDPRH
jgi:tetratricopeptide (TPR) repeat protein